VAWDAYTDDNVVDQIDSGLRMREGNLGALIGLVELRTSL
jgi:hypothetical protein